MRALSFKPRYLYDRLCAARRFCLDVATKRATQPSHRAGGLIKDDVKAEAVSEVGLFCVCVCVGVGVRAFFRGPYP